MATTLDGIVIKVGRSGSDAIANALAIDAPFPYVEWSLPPGIVQRRFAVRISCIEQGATAFTTSGPQTSAEQHFQFPSGVALNDNFAGLCKIEVAISQSESGEFEFAAPPVRVVYDRELERLLHADGVVLSWVPGTDDDNLGSGGTRTFQIQIAHDVNFTVIVYDTEDINNISDSVVSHTVPPEDFVPEPDVVYLWRVRQSDGLDWSDWSKVNAFVDFDDVPPSVVIISATPFFDSRGTVQIVFEVEDDDSESVSVEMSYSRSTGDRIPLAINESLTHLPPGSHIITWDTLSQLGRGRFTDIFLFAVARDLHGRGIETFLGPIEIDNTYIDAPGGGVGSTAYIFPVVGVITRKSPASNISQVSPVVGRIKLVEQVESILYQLSPARPGDIALSSAYHVGPFEPHNLSVVSEPNLWPMLARSAGGGFELASHFETPLGNVGLGNPHATNIRMVFLDPTNYAWFSDAWPRPITSREMAGTRYLRGWIGYDGRHNEYPNGYDFNSRPSWHIGREWWGHDDGWVQIAREEKTSWELCETCDGRDWVPSPSPPYTRLACPNPTCVDGFDHDLPLVNDANDRQRVMSYARPAWVRLRSLLHEHGYPIHERIPLKVLASHTASASQYIAGRHLTDVDADRDSGGEIEGYVIDEPQGRRTLPASTQAVWALEDSNVRGLTRDIGGGSQVRGFATATQYDEASMEIRGFPATVKIEHASSIEGNILPVVGAIAPERDWFFIGQDPDSNPGMGRRPRPTQAGGFKVSGRVARIYDTQPLAFRFMPPWWDGYNTIHWSATGSSSSKFHLQYARYVSNVPEPWQDAKGDNARPDSESGMRLIDPLVFHMFWNTINQSLFASGYDYRLRVRMYDPISRRATGWVYSPVFQIIRGVTNPASVVTTEYEPWSKRVYFTVRIDDTAQRTYNLTKFWYSKDDGYTWQEINGGDIGGEIHNLGSTIGSNLHEFAWLTDSYGLLAGDVYRIRIECLPTNVSKEIAFPFFRWYSLPNPVGDPAMSAMVEAYGRVEAATLDPDTGELVQLANPINQPGGLWLLGQEELRIQRHTTPDAPQGYFTFVDEEGDVTDQEGLDQWLDESYRGLQTHGAALSENQVEQSELLRNAQNAQAIQAESERWCRRNLITQGYYAEEHFIEVSGHIEEMVVAMPAGTHFDDPADEIPIQRNWRFRVESVAAGPSGVISDEGSYQPIDLTSLERVYYKFQLDPRTTFDSQPHRMPLRNVLFNHVGQRLGIASFSAPAGVEGHTGYQSPSIDDARDAESDIDNVISDTDLGGTLPRSETFTSVGGIYKMPPSMLPGQEDDVLPEGMETWFTTYRWRVAAYNAMVAPLNARPRPEIYSTTIDQTGAIVCRYRAKAHPKLLSASMATGGGFVTGYEISTGYLSSAVWISEVIDFVSDRRADPESKTYFLNPVPWTPKGDDRPRPWAFYDDHLMQYVMFTSKKDFKDRWRIVQSRGMSLPKFCEFKLHFDDSLAAYIYGPSVIPVGSSYLMLMTFHAAPSSPPAIYRSTSSDCESWSQPLHVEALGEGAYPCVVLEDGIFHIWFERYSGGVVKIFYATSEDGIEFEMGNGGTAVYSRVGDVGSPAVVRDGAAWVMYFNDVSPGCISSVRSSDGVSWGSYKQEISSSSVEGTTGTPRNPCAILDPYRGNLEPRLFFNYLLASNSESRVWTSRREDRQWSTGAPGAIFGAAGNLTSVPFSRDGVDRAFSVSGPANGVLPSDPIKVRVNFSVWSPENVEYHRQSEWVGPQIRPGEYLDPRPWKFHEQLPLLPYMES